MIELDVRVLAVQAVTFLIAFGLLSRLAFKPLMALLDARARKVGEDLDAADKARQSAARAAAEGERERAEAKRLAVEQLRQAVEESRQARDAILREAQEQGRALLTEAERRLAEEQVQASRALRREAADLAARLAEKVMAESLTPAAHDRLVDETVAAVALAERPARAGTKG